MSDLRPYQEKAVDDLRRSIRGGAKAPVLVSPCGSGKTLIAKAIIDSAVSKGNQVLFLAPRRELIYQTVEKLDRAGIPCGIIMAGESPDMMAQVQVACVPTLHRRMERTYLPPAAVVICDEAHLFVARMMREILACYANALKIGLTASPCRNDGRGLGEIFDALVMGPLPSELIEGGYLVKPEYYAPSTPDLSRIKIKRGDYDQTQLGHRMDDPKLIGDVVNNWFRLASDRQTLVYGVNISHAMHLCERFVEAGVSAEHLDSTTPLDKRREILRRFENGESQVVTNVQVFSYGIDVPIASACVLAHPTKSLARYIQAGGRVFRPHPGKTDCLIIDHAGIIDKLGRIEDDHPWSLDGKSRIQDRMASRERKAPKDLTCPECALIFRSAAECPGCGHAMRHHHRAKAIEATEADLVKFEKRGKDRERRQWTMDEKSAFYAELLGVARDRGYKNGWASHKYREKFGVWPQSLKHIQPCPPSMAVMSWVKSRQIAYAKGREKGRVSHG